MRGPTYSELEGNMRGTINSELGSKMRGPHEFRAEKNFKRAPTFIFRVGIKDDPPTNSELGRNMMGPQIQIWE